METPRAAASEHDQAWLSEVRRELHRIPELGFELPRTVERVLARIRAIAPRARVREGVGRSGIVVDVDVAGLPAGADRWAFRADMDALPLDEESGENFTSEHPGRAHMCGHDAHMAILLGFLKSAVERPTGLRRNLRLLFQPSEEIPPGGAKAMIADGCLEGAQRVFGLHVFPIWEVGQVALSEGPVMACADFFDLTITGQGGHAAYPHLARDPVSLIVRAAQAFEGLLARHVDPLQPAVIAVTKLGGGQANNVIPQTASLGGTVRTFDRAVRDALRAAMVQAVEGICAPLGARAIWDYREGYDPTVNDEGAVAFARAALAGGGRELVPFRPMMGGEDFAYCLQARPGAFLGLGCGNRQAGITHFCHSPRFRIDERCLMVGVEVFRALASAPESYT